MISFGDVFGKSLGLLGAFWGRLGGLLGCILEVLGRLLGILEAKLERNIVMDGFRFPGGPSWRRLGVVFVVFGGRFGLNFEAFQGTVCTAN